MSAIRVEFTYVLAQSTETQWGGISQSLNPRGQSYHRFIGTYRRYNALRLTDWNTALRNCRELERSPLESELAPH